MERILVDAFDQPRLALRWPSLLDCTWYCRCQLYYS